MRGHTHTHLFGNATQSLGQHRQGCTPEQVDFCWQKVFVCYKNMINSCIDFDRAENYIMSAAS